MSRNIGATRIIRGMDTSLLQDAYDLIVKMLEGVELDRDHADRLANDIWDVLHFDGSESWPCYACGRRYPTQQEAHDCDCAHIDGSSSSGEG